MKPLALLLALLLVSGCAAPARRAAPELPDKLAAVPPVAPKPPEQPQAAPPAAGIERVAVGYLQKDEGGVLLVPPVTTVFAVAPEGAVVSFYARAEQGPVRQLGQAAATDSVHHSLTFTVPRDLGVLTVWAVISKPGDALPEQPPAGAPTARIRPAPAGGSITELGGFPLYPVFPWHTKLTEQERQELSEWLGPGWEQGADLIAYSGRLFDISTAEANQWTQGNGLKAGWEGLVPAGGGSAWGMVGTRDGVKVRVNFALGYGGGPPARPELGYGMVVRIYK